MSTTGAATPPRVSVAGCPIDPLTFAETLARIERLISAGTPTQHCVVNAHKAVLMERDLRLREIVSGCALVNADGQSIVWAARILGQPLPERVTGIDLFQALLQLAADRGYGVYFLGAKPAVVEKVVARARREHARLRICGWRHGYWTDDEVGDLIAAVRTSNADLLFLGIPSPRKEYWLAEHLQALGVPFCMGVGGSFDVYAGEVKRAPRWMQRTGLEWVFRFAQEPGRMWRRYLLGNLSFLLLVLRYRLRPRGRRGEQPARRDNMGDDRA